MDGGEEDVCKGKTCRKRPFLFLSPRSLWRLSCFSNCDPLPLYPLSKATRLSIQAFREKYTSAAPLLSCSFILPPSPQASPTVILPQLDNGKKLNREAATIFLRLNEVLELSCTPKKGTASILANELFSFY